MVGNAAEEQEWRGDSGGESSDTKVSETKRKGLRNPGWEKGLMLRKSRALVRGEVLGV